LKVQAVHAVPAIALSLIVILEDVVGKLLLTSSSGWCGNSDLHCTLPGCQALYSPGTCISAPVGTIPISTDGRCGTVFGTKCPSGKCCRYNIANPVPQIGVAALKCIVLYQDVKQHILKKHVFHFPKELYHLVLMVDAVLILELLVEIKIVAGILMLIQS
jgi:hypothetical protein